MKDRIIKWRNGLIAFFYRYFLKPIFFRSDPENVHDKMVYLGFRLGYSSFFRKVTNIFFGYKNSLLNQKVLDINFENPIGLAAGFDKDAVLTNILPNVGFGFMEVGSITADHCPGNPKPRLWRLPKSESLVVYYGLKNKGAEYISNYLKGRSFKIPVGISIAMTNCEENLDIERAVGDYEKSMNIFSDMGSYITINISCPNTLGGQPFLEPENLKILLDCLDKVEIKKPIFIKLSPDTDVNKTNLLLEIADQHRVHGIICTNLTKKRDNPNIVEDIVPSVGGMSGKVVQSMSDNLLSYIYRRYGKRFILVGCGGVFSAEDAYKKIRSGATLVQMVTGLIYKGPQVVSQINMDLAKLLEIDGYKNISEAIGVDVI